MPTRTNFSNPKQKSLCSAFNPSTSVSLLSRITPCHTLTSPRKRLNLPTPYSRKATLCMNAPSKKDNSDKSQQPADLTPTEQKANEPEFSTWGIASFAIIFLIFLLSILATLSRDFIPGGLVDPAHGVPYVS